ncbi:hypothetical protein [Anaeromyxobacter paludicola]|uniref:Uncharacterized protein n=1 Tax=Anaeromyxobacter paludicola TaxID=2918171 RepID=A0ABN6N9X5_9BACT|nr:hypothetical protein [Anaeromyxobacter paludicola]BDG10037.1 hypothetical protein AMPC_31500 [Anaeromyxobacter paludicola]
MRDQLADACRGEVSPDAPCGARAPAAEGSLRPGDWVEVRSPAEIASTLDGDGAVEGLPFMPEMVPWCGQRLRVALRAEHTCVHPPEGRLRRLRNAVTLEGLRCDGASHAGCQLGCALFWKECWLRPVTGPSAPAVPAGPAASADLANLPVHPRGAPDRWQCQGTALPAATSRGEPLWSPGQYVRMVEVRTFTARQVVEMLLAGGMRRVRKVLRRRASSPPAPAPSAAPLRVGDWVQVRGREEIFATLDEHGKLQGLAFGGDMEDYCGVRARVGARVERIIEEATGRLRTVRGTVILERVSCRRYLGCARAMPILWREAWLRPAPPPGR